MFSLLPFLPSSWHNTPLSALGRRRAGIVTASLSLAWCAAAMLFIPAHAHDVFAQRVLLIQFGDADERLDPYHPDQVTAVRAMASDGTALPVTLLPIGETGVTIQSPAGDPIAVTVHWDGGYRVKPTPGDKWQKATRAEAEAAGAYLHSSVISLRVFAWHPALATPHGTDLEIVPLADPAAATVGGHLPVRVLRDGKPLSGVALRTGDAKDALLSDDSGLVQIPLTAAGLLFIKASVSDTVGQTEQVRRATLVVSVPGP